MRVRLIPFVLALMGAMFASVVFAEAASAHVGKVAIGCSQVTFTYKRFSAGTNTVSETITVDGVAEPTRTFVFTGSTGSDTVPNAIAPGTHTVTVFAQWKQFRTKSITDSETITCGGIG